MIFGHHLWFLLIFTPTPQQINQEDKILQLLKSWTQLFAVLTVTSPVEGTTALLLLCEVVRARLGTPYLHLGHPLSGLAQPSWGLGPESPPAQTGSREPDLAFAHTFLGSDSQEHFPSDPHKGSTAHPCLWTVMAFASPLVPLLFP